MHRLKISKLSTALKTEIETAFPLFDKTLHYIFLFSNLQFNNIIFSINIQPIYIGTH